MNDEKETWQQVDAYLHRFEEAWQNGGRPAIEDFLPEDGPIRLAVLKELVQVDVERRRQAGEFMRLDDYLQRFPELAAGPPSMSGLATIDEALQQKPGNGGSVVTPQRIGRYRVEKVLGRGGFGIVYLAHDDQLQRPVAIKVPHRRLVSLPEDAEAYLTEARTVAKLDHPNIVPVHDVGSTDECPFFIVSRFIEGTTLRQRIKDERLSVNQSAEIVAIVAQALHYAHHA